MDNIRIGYFLEDIGHELFLTSLVNRVAQEMGLNSSGLIHEVRNATGGQGRVLNELERFLRDVNRGRQRVFDLLVVAVDGNCHRYQRRHSEIMEVVRRSGYSGEVICAVPNPHIERWYVADSRGLRSALHTGNIPDAPRYKCERGRYKQALRDAIRQTGVRAPLGGIEFGPDIVQAIDLHTVGRVDTGFKHFVDEIRAGLMPFASTPASSS